MEIVDPLLGKQLGNYRLEQRLGHGSCGVVYLCEHVKLGTPFAIKILHPILASNEESSERFLREARTAARIQHENVVFIADFDIEPSVGPYFVMEYLDGPSLRDLIDQEAPFDAARVANLCEQICHAIAAAHRAGVIHRDLKPENICVLQRQREIVKILDFGIAKITRDGLTGGKELTQQGRVLGTPRYLSPEQAQGAELDHRSDLYAFGIILYELLLGEPPFKGRSPEELVLHHLTLPPPTLDPERFPSDLQDLLNWLLAKRPDERPSDMDEVWSLLEEALSQMQVAPRRLRSGYASSQSLTALPAVNTEVSRTRGYAEADPLPLRIHKQQGQQAGQTLPFPGTHMSEADKLVNVLLDVLDKNAHVSTTLRPDDFAREIKEALDKETTLHHSQPPEVVRQAIREALDKETTLHYREPPARLLEALEVALNDPTPRPYMSPFLSEEQSLTEAFEAIDEDPDAYFGVEDELEQTTSSGPSGMDDGGLLMARVTSYDGLPQLDYSPSGEHSLAPPPNALDDELYPSLAESDDSPTTAVPSPARREGTVSLRAPKPTPPQLGPEDSPTQQAFEPLGGYAEAGDADAPTERFYPMQLGQHKTTPEPQETAHDDGFEPTVAHGVSPYIGAESSETESNTAISPIPHANPSPPQAPPMPAPVPPVQAFAPPSDYTPLPPTKPTQKNGMASPISPSNGAHLDKLLDASLVSVSPPPTKGGLSGLFVPVLGVLLLCGVGLAFWVGLGSFSSQEDAGMGSTTPEPPCIGKFRIKTEPKGASVWSQGIRVGKTPYEHRGKCEAEIRFTLRHKGYKPFTLMHRLDQSGNTYEYKLTRLQRPRPRRPRASIVILHLPRGTSVYYRRHRICRNRRTCMLKAPYGQKRRYRLRRRRYRKYIKITFSNQKTKRRYYSHRLRLIRQR